MTIGDKKALPVKEGLWRIPSSSDEKPKLIANKCLSCGEILFPKRESCINCQSADLEEIGLSRRGKIYSFCVVMQRPAAFYKGPVPYAMGYVELPEGVRIETLFTDCDFEALGLGMDVELVIERLHEDEDGNEIMSYKFRPVVVEGG